MASYTMQLREYLEQATQHQTGLSSRQIIEAGRPKLFDFEYPIFDEAYRNVFETHFIRNFYMREIGFETEGLFKFQLESWLLINMPFFNKMFESELLIFDPLKNSEDNVTHTKIVDKNKDDIRDITQNTTSNEIGKSILVESGTVGLVGETLTSHNTTSDDIVASTSVKDSTSGETDSKDTTDLTTDDNFKRNLESNTPDSRLTITTNDGAGVIEYASKIDEVNENNTRTGETHSDGTRNVTGNDTTTNDGTTNTITTGGGSSNTIDNTTTSDNATNDLTSDSIVDGVSKDTLNSVINETEDYVQHRIGKVGNITYSEMLEKYRHSFLRIEKQMFTEMQELFMLVY